MSGYAQSGVTAGMEVVARAGLVTLVTTAAWSQPFFGLQIVSDPRLVAISLKRALSFVMSYDLQPPTTDQRPTTTDYLLPTTYCVRPISFYLSLITY